MKPETIHDWKNTEVLITGGTGSLGKTITKLLLSKYEVRGLRIMSRDELKQSEMKKELRNAGLLDKVDFIIGDVRDSVRFYRATKGVDLIINAAAMKQVPACEHNPFEAVKTNIDGTRYLINAAIDNDVSMVMHISTDKAVYPINLYGMTKAVAEKMLMYSDVYTGGHGTKFSCCRYGNVLGSRGSVIPLFKEQVAKNGHVTITDKRMTRFWISLEEVAHFVIDRCMEAQGGEIFVPKMPSCKIMDLAKVFVEENKINEIGIRQGEKLHECLITREESLYTHSREDYFVIKQSLPHDVITDFSYDSDSNPCQLRGDQIKNKLQEAGLLW